MLARRAKNFPLRINWKADRPRKFLATSQLYQNLPHSQDCSRDHRRCLVRRSPQGFHLLYNIFFPTVDAAIPQLFPFPRSGRPYNPVLGNSLSAQIRCETVRKQNRELVAVFLKEWPNQTRIFINVERQNLNQSVIRNPPSMPIRTISAALKKAPFPIRKCREVPMCFPRREAG